MLSITPRHSTTSLAMIAGLLVFSQAALGIVAPGDRAARISPRPLGEAIAAADAPVELHAAANNLLSRFPGVRVYSWRGRVLALYGKAMTWGATPEMAAGNFLARHGEAFGAGRPDLRETWHGSIDGGRFVAFHYAQYLDGLAVERGLFRVAVRTTGDDPGSAINNRVVLASGRLAKEPEGGFAPDTVDGDKALALLRGAPENHELTSWTEPELVVYFGEGDLDAWITPVRAWKITGERPATPQKFTFFVNAADGRVVFTRDEVCFADVTGSTRAMVTPGSGASTATNLAVDTPLADLRVIAGSYFGYSTAAGTIEFTLGTGPAAVSATLATGRWAGVRDNVTGTPVLSDSDTVGVPGAFALTVNDVPGEYTTAMANGFFYQTLSHNYFRALATAFTPLDSMLPVNVNIASTCNAYYDGSSTNFYHAGGTCNNTAFGSVIAHEYGHHIVNRLGLSQGAFGEGFGDTISMMIFDDPIVGRNFTTAGGAVRTPATTVTAYPCPGTEVHLCGQTLGGVVWTIRNYYGVAFGSQAGLTLARAQHAAWAQLTSGGLGNDSAGPLTAIEWLTIDDTNADLDDGTPNYARLNLAFLTRSIPLPARLAIDFNFPDTDHNADGLADHQSDNEGLPRAKNINDALSMRVLINDVTTTHVAGSERIHYRRGNSGAFHAEPLGHGAAPNEFIATLPGGICGQVQYYLSVQGTDGTTYAYPPSAPATPFFIASTGGVLSQSLLSDDFESDQGWTESFTQIGTRAVSGQWVRGEPIGTAAQPEGDSTSDAGASCYFTGQGTVGGGVGQADIDNATVYLESPTFSLVGASDGHVRYWLWYTNDAGAAPNADSFRVDASSNGGATWATVETVGPSTPMPHAWYQHDLDLSATPGLAFTSAMKIRFVAEDAGTGSVVEAAVDDVQISRVTCPCPADVDDGSGAGVPDGAVEIGDLLYYIGRYEAGDASADVDNGSGLGARDGAVEINDLLYFLSHFEGGC